MRKAKIIVVAVVLVLCLSVSAVAFAASSPEASAVVPSGDAKDTTVSLGTIADKVALEAKIEKTKAPGVVMFFQDINLTNPDGTPYKGSATLTINVAGVKAGDVVTVVHYLEGGVPEYIKPSKVEDGKVTFTVSSMCPIAIVVQAAAPAADAATTTAKSPKTGDAENMMLWIALAVAATGIVAVTARKASKASK